MTTTEAAAALGLTPQRVRALIKAGRLPSAHLEDTPRGPVWQIDPADLARPDIQERRGGRPRLAHPTPGGPAGGGGEETQTNER